MLIILLSMCVHTACGYVNDENRESETEQKVFTEEDLPVEIKKLLSYKN